MTDIELTGIRQLHPGYILDFEYIKPLKFYKNQILRETGITEDEFNEFISLKTNVTIELAEKLGKLIGSPSYWLKLQKKFDTMLNQDNEIIELVDNFLKHLKTIDYKSSFSLNSIPMRFMYYIIECYDNDNILSKFSIERIEYILSKEIMKLIFNETLTIDDIFIDLRSGFNSIELTYE